MELYFLGTNAGVPSLERNVTSIALRMLEERRTFWLFDCGEGTQHQILRSPLKLSKLEKIFITHLHGDHLFGLPGLISSRAYQGGEDPLTIYGPPGLKQYIHTSLELSESHISYSLDIVEHEGESCLRMTPSAWKPRCWSIGLPAMDTESPRRICRASLMLPCWRAMAFVQARYMAS